MKVPNSIPQLNLFTGEVDQLSIERRCIVMKRKNTQIRYGLICQKFNTIYAYRVEGIPLDYDCVIAKVAADTGFSIKTIKRALKT